MNSSLFVLYVGQIMTYFMFPECDQISLRGTKNSHRLFVFVMYLLPKILRKFFTPSSMDLCNGLLIICCFIKVFYSVASLTLPFKVYPILIAH